MFIISEAKYMRFIFLMAILLPLIFHLLPIEEYAKIIAARSLLRLNEQDIVSSCRMGYSALL